MYKKILLIVSLFYGLSLITGGLLFAENTIPSSELAGIVDHSVAGIKLNKQELLKYQHPIMIGENADIEDGIEYIIRNKNGDKAIYYHIVIPKGIKSPKDLNRNIIYKGRFSKIQNWEKFTIKKPYQDYEYFIVESWKYIELNG